MSMMVNTYCQLDAIVLEIGPKGRANGRDGRLLR